MMFDLPHPFGPTTPIRLLGKLTAVGSTKDLNPANLILLSRIALPNAEGRTPKKIQVCARRFDAYAESRSFMCP
jgi:hypothetical protein